MRDPTRGGLATVCHEIRPATGLGIRLQQAAIPLRDPVQSVCDMLGYDPLYLACEGRVVAVVAGTRRRLCWRLAQSAARRGCRGHRRRGRAQPAVLLETALGGERILEELEDDPLPRIC